ncbi:adenylate cyclase [Brucella endophytica]|uniref:Adenylate cyclase n=1 Tax=Brucella endophytica TaxID=1963359 RepID=A0A916SKQ1_9HYPH|nr:adenylate cyclase [Brucella endophytica]
MEKAQSLSSQPPEIIAQTDVFFRAAVGRLKLRILSPAHGELIFYDRTDQAGPKTSIYMVSVTNQPSALRAVLSAACGEDITVQKIRKRYLIGRTRVHVDAVENLGDFVELEVMLKEGENPDDGVVEAQNLMDELGIKQADLIENAYADLLKVQTFPA